MDSTSLDTNGHLAQVRALDNTTGSTSNGNVSVAQPDSANSEEASEASQAAANALKVRKRTKTGCLTCRRRRIKCGEERPTCKNCTKSKRECEGYVPRVVFKDPVSAFRQDLDALQEHHLYGPFDPNIAAGFGNMTADGVPLAPLAPRPSPYEEFNGFTHSSSRISSRMDEQWVSAGAATYTGQGAENHIDPGTFGVSSAQQSQQSTTNGHVPSLHSADRRASATVPAPFSGQEAWATSVGDVPVTPSHPMPSSSWAYDAAASTAQVSHYPTPLTGISNDGTFQAPTWQVSSLVNDSSMHVPPTAAEQDQRRFSAGEDHQVHQLNQLYSMQSHSAQPRVEPEDEPFDVDSDEENMNIDNQLGEVEASDLGLMIHMSAHQNNVGLRSMTNFLNEPNVLAEYQPAYAATPLMDSHTARVFCHFITATGPTLNVCERHPANASVIFSGRPVPQAQRALWSYTLPMLALKHQGLLHAMLALSSLHIARLQHTSPTPSLKHYHYALRRVAKALGNPIKRRDVATLAATLLLGFYEVTTAEHNKWNSHLSGARELIVEIDYAGMSRRIEAQRTRQEEEEARHRKYDYANFFSKSPVVEEMPAKAARGIDERLISTIMGWSTKYNEYGEVVDDTLPTPATEEPLKEKDIETFQVQCDLFWWYAKQDMYQSILSGNRLLLSYDRWGQCPPRAPIGRQDAAYGTMDHLLLLMARLADFAAKDLPRKRRASVAAERAKAQSQSQSQSQPPGPSPPGGQKGQSPPFYGMMPDPGPIRLPYGFNQSQHDKIYSMPAPSDNKSLDIATAEAHAEHAAIAQAFSTFEEAMGPSFAPLSSEHMTPTATPFGPAIYYRSYPIACIQTLLQCGHVIRIRTAPNMPPAAMAAAGMAAPLTAVHANTIGRICAGIQPVSNTAPLNPHHGAALMDVCMALFHAGVQYRDPAQRGWTITKLRDVARLTGWQTSALIASGCERAWTRAAEMGKGPPYERTMNSTAKDDRVAGRSRDPRFMASAPRNNNDRRYVKQNAGTRVYWAMGILSVEEDMADMSLTEGEL